MFTIPTPDFIGEMHTHLFTSDLIPGEWHHNDNNDNVMIHPSTPGHFMFPSTDFSDLPEPPNRAPKHPFPGKPLTCPTPEPPPTPPPGPRPGPLGPRPPPDTPSPPDTP